MRGRSLISIIICASFCLLDSHSFSMEYLTSSDTDDYCFCKDSHYRITLYSTCDCMWKCVLVPCKWYHTNEVPFTETTMCQISAVIINCSLFFPHFLSFHYICEVSFGFFICFEKRSPLVVIIKFNHIWGWYTLSPLQHCIHTASETTVTRGRRLFWTVWDNLLNF